MDKDEKLTTQGIEAVVEWMLSSCFRPQCFCSIHFHRLRPDYLWSLLCPSTRPLGYPYGREVGSLSPDRNKRYSYPKLSAGALKSLHVRL